MELRAFGRTLTIKSRRDVDTKAWEEGLVAAFGTGNVVSAQDALGIATVLRCVDLIASTMASIGCELLQHQDTSVVPARDHQFYDLVLRAPNNETTAYDFWHLLFTNMLLTPAGVIWKHNDANGVATSLDVVPYSMVGSGIQRNAATGERFLVMTGSWQGQTITKTLYPDEFIWIPGRRLDHPDVPMDVIELASRTLGLTRRLDTFASNYFDNGTAPSGILTYEGTPNDETFRAIIKRFREEYVGLANQNKVLGLTSKMKWTPLDAREPDKSQALESRRFQVSEICRLFGVPPHLVFDMDRATYSNAEQLNTEFVQYGLMPLCVQVEQALLIGMFTSPLLRRRYEFNFNTDNLLRGDLATRTAYYNLMRNAGIMNADEIRERENLPRIPNGDGQIYLVNGAMIPLSEAKNNKPKAAQSQPPQQPKGGEPNGNPQ